MAFEVYTEDPTSDSEIDETEESTEEASSLFPAATPTPPDFLGRFSALNLRPSTPTSPKPTPHNQIIPSPQKAPAPTPQYQRQPPTSLPTVKTSLSLLEMLIRLTALQQFQQSSHLAIPDEFLNFFLSDSSTVGAGGDAELRRRVRREARMRVGFDPYDESPIKRRGEEYLEHELHEHEHVQDGRDEERSVYGDEDTLTGDGGGGRQHLLPESTSQTSNHTARSESPSTTTASYLEAAWLLAKAKQSSGTSYTW
ncbi:unnamed protein product [Alternaria alternata]